MRRLTVIDRKQRENAERRRAQRALPWQRTEWVRVKMPKGLKAQLEMEAWESGLDVNDYVYGLLQRRGKWARSVGRAGGYELRNEVGAVL